MAGTQTNGYGMMRKQIREIREAVFVPIPFRWCSMWIVSRFFVERIKTDCIRPTEQAAAEACRRRGIVIYTEIWLN